MIFSLYANYEKTKGHWKRSKTKPSESIKWFTFDKGRIKRKKCKRFNMKGVVRGRIK